MNDSPVHELAPGLAAHKVTRFTSTNDLAELLAAATTAGQSVSPFGGRNSLATGNLAPVSSVGLDMTSNTGVIAYEPADLTLSVRSGTTWAELQSILGERGQELPLDVPHPETTTVGGVVATGFAGARRLRQGTLRDLLIGCEYVRGDGLAAKAGGMVVKNVSGFEVPRFLHGSWGALAVLTSVNIKVMPKPRADGTATVTFDTLTEALAAGQDLASSPQPLDAIAVAMTNGEPTLAIRATGRARAVEEMLAESLPASATPAVHLAQEASAAWWQQITNAFAGAPEIVGVAFTAGLDRLAALVHDLHTLVPRAQFLIMPGYGSVRMTLTTSQDNDTPSTLTAVQDIARRHAAMYVLESAPPELRNVIPAWGDPGNDYATMLALKRSFDPGHTLNRGRLFV